VYAIATNPGQNQYNSQMECAWTLVAPPFHHIFLQIFNFATELAYDFVTVRGRNTFFRDSGLSSSKPDLLRQFYFPSHFNMDFKSDNSVVGDGVRAVAYWVCSNTSVTLTGSSTESIFFGSNAASSPDINFLPTYAALLNCTWTLMPQPGYHARVVFDTTFATETNFDFVSAFDGPTVSSPLLSTTSGVIPPAARTASAAMTISFRSDVSVQLAGFRATFTQVGTFT
jgi:hypothetical protein